MDPRDLSMYQHPRMAMMGQSDIDSVPESIPINYQMDNAALGMQRASMSDHHASFTQNAPQLNRMASQPNYNQLPGRKEVNDQERMDDELINKTTAHNPTEENGAAHLPTRENEAGHLHSEENDAEYLPTEDEIKTEAEDQDDISNFMQTAHDVFLRISSNELKIKEAADLLGREYSFVYSRYQEFCDEITGKDSKKSKKKGSKSKKKGKKARKAKRITMDKRRAPGRIWYCDDCPASFNSEYRMKSHEQMHLQNKESHLCTACGVIFPKMGTLMQHRIEAHGDALQCPHCEEQFSVVASYRYHVRSHSKVTPFVCKECGQGFFSKYTLRDHERIHTGERPFMCGHCDKTFTTIGNLKSHQYVHNGWPDRPKVFPCKVCGKKYDSKYKVKQHMISHTGEKPYSCDLCDGRFNLKANLARHRVKHTGEKPFHCKLCPATFAFETDLKRHDMAHTGIKPFKCSFCDYSCVRKNLLEYHMNTHTGEKPYKCDFYGCSAEYSGLSTLKKHKLKHGPPPIKTCKVCNENFPDMNSLKCHMMIHPGHKPIPCDQCEKIFYNESTLKRHMHVHMYKPDGDKAKPVRIRSKNPAGVKRPRKVGPPEKPLTSLYQAQQPALADNGHSSIGHSTSLAHTWTINAEDTNSQQSMQSLHHFPGGPSQLTNLNAWPQTMDPDELRRRLLTSFQ